MASPSLNGSVARVSVRVALRETRATASLACVIGCVLMVFGLLFRTVETSLRARPPSIERHTGVDPWLSNAWGG